MTTHVSIDVPKGAPWKVKATLEMRKWNSEANAYGEWAGTNEELYFLPGVTGRIDIWDTRRIASIEEVPLTETEKKALGTSTSAEGSNPA